MKQMVTSLFGMFGSAVALLFGGWDIALQTLDSFYGNRLDHRRDSSAGDF